MLQLRSLAREGCLGGVGDVASELSHVGLGDVLVLAVGAEDGLEPARHRGGGCGRRRSLVIAWPAGWLAACLNPSLTPLPLSLTL